MCVLNLTMRGSNSYRVNGAFLILFEIFFVTWILLMIHTDRRGIVKTKSSYIGTNATMDSLSILSTALYRQHMAKVQRKDSMRGFTNNKKLFTTGSRKHFVKQLQDSVQNQIKHYGESELRRKSNKSVFSSGSKRDKKSEITRRRLISSKQKSVVDSVIRWNLQRRDLNFTTLKSAAWKGRKLPDMHTTIIDARDETEETSVEDRHLPEIQTTEREADDSTEEPGTNIKKFEVLPDPSSPGDWGTAVEIDIKNLTSSERAKYKSGLSVHDFSSFVSDLIPLNRRLPDPRNKDCKKTLYPENLPKTSVIICFWNEALSVLLRTVHSVLNRSPSHLIEEIILVDDFSTLAELTNVEERLSTITNVRVIKTEAHGGLIRARLLGVEHATADVITFLDSHVECFDGWLEPLLARVKNKPNTVICPRIELIDMQTFKVDVLKGLFLSNFKLSDLTFDWIPVPWFDKQYIDDWTQPVKSPMLAGGLFTINKTLFINMGGYDPYMYLWGGENLELAFRMWMCGGEVEIHPCSHVAHLFRMNNPLHRDAKLNFDTVAERNKLRVAQVWMDDYKKFFINSLKIANVSAGDLTDRQALRQSLDCHNFQWYIDNVYPHIYIPGKGVLAGEIRNQGANICVDSLVGLFESRVGLRNCSGINRQFWQLTKFKEIRREEGCLEYNKKQNKLQYNRCDGGGPSQLWEYLQDKWIYNSNSKLCLSVAQTGRNLQMSKCNDLKFGHWTWRNTGHEDIYRT